MVLVEGMPYNIVTVRRINEDVNSDSILFYPDDLHKSSPEKERELVAVFLFF